MNKKSITFEDAIERLARFKVTASDLSIRNMSFNISDILAILFMTDENSDFERFFRTSLKVRKVYNLELIRQGYLQPLQEFTKDDIWDAWEDCDEETELGNFDLRYRYRITIDALQRFFPLFNGIELGNHGFADIIRSHELLPNGSDLSSEHGGTFLSFPTKNHAFQFINDFNAMLRHWWNVEKEQFFNDHPLNDGNEDLQPSEDIELSTECDPVICPHCQTECNGICEKE